MRSTLIKVSLLGIALGISLLSAFLTNFKYDRDTQSFTPTVLAQDTNPDPKFPDSPGTSTPSNNNATADPKFGNTAQQTPAGTKNSPLLEEVTKLLEMVLTTGMSLNLPIVMIIGKLISNDWVYLEANVGGVLNTMWILVRNLVNISFVVILIIAAFMAVVGAGGDKSNFAIKSLLPRFVFALLFVNFSFLVGKLLLDAGNLATTATFSMVNEVGPAITQSPGTGLKVGHLMCWAPSKIKDINGNDIANELTLEKGAYCDPEKYPNRCKCLTGKFLLGFGKEAYKDLDERYQFDQNKDNDLLTTSKAKDYVYGFVQDTESQIKYDDPISSIVFNARNAMFIYSYNIFRLAELRDAVDSKNLSAQVSSEGGLAINTLISLAMALMLLILNAAMLIAFAVRMVLIWLLLVFSPVVALEIIFPDKVKGKIPLLKNGFVQTFAGLAFMPAICGFILSLGFIMFQVLKSQPILNLGSISIGVFTIVTKGVPIPGFGSLQELILAFVIMIIVWMSIFAALKTNDYVGKAVKGIEDFGSGLAKIGKDAIKNVPIIPTPFGKLASAESLRRVPSLIQSQINKQSDEDLKKLLKDTPLEGLLNLKIPSEFEQTLNQLSSSVKDGKIALEGDVRKKAIEFFAALPSFAGNLSSEQRDNLVKVTNALGIREDLVTDLITNPADPDARKKFIDAIKKKDQKLGTDIEQALQSKAVSSSQDATQQANFEKTDYKINNDDSGGIVTFTAKQTGSDKKERTAKDVTIRIKKGEKTKDEVRAQIVEELKKKEIVVTPEDNQVTAIIDKISPSHFKPEPTTPTTTQTPPPSTTGSNPGATPPPAPTAP